MKSKEIERNNKTIDDTSTKLTNVNDMGRHGRTMKSEQSVHNIIKNAE